MKYCSITKIVKVSEQSPGMIPFGDLHDIVMTANEKKIIPDEMFDFYTVYEFVLSLQEGVRFMTPYGVELHSFTGNDGYYLCMIFSDIETAMMVQRSEVPSLANYKEKRDAYFASLYLKPLHTIISPVDSDITSDLVERLYSTYNPGT